MSARAIDSPTRPILLFVVNVAWFFRMHRLHLALAAQRAGFEVHVATAPDTPEDVQVIVDAGLTHHSLDLRRGRVSLGAEWRLTRRLFNLYRELQPSIVHQVTIKPVMCGTFAARLARVPGVVNAISGLGFIFIATGWLAQLRRFAVLWAYRLLFSRRDIRVIFENSDDLRLFIAKSVVRPEQAVLIRGAGVDLARFQPRPPTSVCPMVLLPARLLWDKGVREFCAAATSLRAAGVEARFVIAGGLDSGNPAAIPAEWIEAEQQAGHIEWWGHRDDIANIYPQASIVCLPSYREGLPTVLIEAAACGCALVTTDVPGCREVVSDGESGLLVPARDAGALERAIRRLLVDEPLRERLAERARQRAAAEFSAERVRADTLSLYARLLDRWQNV